MGLDRVDKLAGEYDITLQGKAYLLRPDTPEGGVARELRPGELGEPLGEPLRAYAEEAGLVMRRSARTPYTMYILEATEYAQEQGQFDAFHRAAYKAYWEDLKDIGDLEVIRETAQSCGLDWGELSQRLESGHHRKTVMAQYQEALELGIRGIPAFLVGNQLFTGAQPYEIFKLAVSRARESMGR